VAAGRALRHRIIRPSATGSIWPGQAVRGARRPVNRAAEVLATYEHANYGNLPPEGDRL